MGFAKSSSSMPGSAWKIDDYLSPSKKKKKKCTALHIWPPFNLICSEMNMGRERNHRAFIGAQERKFVLFRLPPLFHLFLQLTSYVSISKAMEVNAEKGCMYFNALISFQLISFQLISIFNPVFHISFIFYRNKMLTVSLKSWLVNIMLFTWWCLVIRQRNYQQMCYLSSLTGWGWQ